MASPGQMSPFVHGLDPFRCGADAEGVMDSVAVDLGLGFGTIGTQIYTRSRVVIATACRLSPFVDGLGPGLWA